MHVNCPSCGAPLPELPDSLERPLRFTCQECGHELRVTSTRAAAGPGAGGVRAEDAGTLFQPGAALDPAGDKSPGEAPAPVAPQPSIHRYRVLSLLGRGAMGEVFLAHDPNTDRKVALKLIAAPRSGDGEEETDAEARSRFLIEARAAGRLHHPGIVVLYDADTDETTGRPYLAMEWVDGRSLRAILRAEGVLPWRRAAAIAARVAAALGHAHERGIVHRDVKPANVLIGSDGAVKVSDFGIAKFVAESHTLTGRVLGTPNYMSPEQVRGDAVDGRSDLFAVGAILYEMLAGEPPFRGDSVASIGYKIAHTEPRPIPAHEDGPPPALEAIVRRALEKDPESRFRSGGELAEALESVLEGREPDRGGRTAAAATVRVGGDAPGAAVRQRRRAVSVRAALGGVAAVLVAAALAFWLAGVVPGADGGPAAPGSAAAEAGGAVARAAAPPPAAAARTATLEVVHFNRLRNAAITVWVDGEKAWTSPLEVPRRFLDRLGGDPVRGSIPVAPGERAIEVRVTQRDSRIDARATLRGRFEAGRTRRLRVVLNVFSSNLRLEWQP